MQLRVGTFAQMHWIACRRNKKQKNEKNILNKSRQSKREIGELRKWLKTCQSTRAHLFDVHVRCTLERCTGPSALCIYVCIACMNVNLGLAICVGSR